MKNPTRTNQSLRCLVIAMAAMAMHWTVMGADTSVLANDWDIDGDALTITAVTQGAHGAVAIVVGGKGLTYQPTAGHNGPDSFTYTITDGNGGTDTATVNLTVTAVNQAPVAFDDSYAVSSDNLLVVSSSGVLTNDTDSDSGDALTATVFTTPTNGVLNLSPDGAFTYFPNDGYAGLDSFSYTVSDGLASDTGDVAITVNALSRTLSINTVSETEADTVFEFVVTLSESSGREVTASFTTVDVSATSPADYISTTGTLTIAPGQVTATLPVTVVGDTIYEPTESFEVTLSAPTRAVLGTATGTGSIVNDDLLPLVTLSGSPATIPEAEGIATVTARLENASSEDVTVNLGFTGTADNSDYTPSVTSIVIAAYATSASMTIVAIDDDLNEPAPNETVLVSVTSVVNGSAMNPREVTVTIIDNDLMPTYSIDDVTVNEDAGVATFTVTFEGKSQQVISIAYSSTNGTATAPSDFTAVSGTLSWASGETGSKTFHVTIVNDDLDEGDETATLTLGSSDHASVLDGVAQLTILRNQHALVIYKGRSGSHFIVLIGYFGRTGDVTDFHGVHWVEYWRSGHYIKKYRLRDDELGLPVALYDTVDVTAIMNIPGSTDITSMDSLLATGPIRQLNLRGSSIQAARVLRGNRIRVAADDNQIGSFQLIEERVTLRLNLTAMNYFLRDSSKDQVLTDTALAYYLGLMVRFGYTLDETR